MYNYDIINSLCISIDLMSKVIDRQAEIISQMELSDEVERELDALRKDSDTQLDIVEYRLRRIE